jgi:hypothetical protein
LQAEKTTGTDKSMADVRVPHLRIVPRDPAPAQTRSPRIRFRPIVQLRDGCAFGVHAETEFSFEDTCRPSDMFSETPPSAAAWLGETIERIARLAERMGQQDRPISLTAPLAALADPDTPMAAEAGARRSRLLPQEIRIDFADASVCALEDQGLERLEAVHARGFRIGLDARRGWRTPMGVRARTIIEAVRLDPALYRDLGTPVSRLEAASAEGVALIAENVHWRDAAELEKLHIGFALSPRTDS